MSKMTQTREGAHICNFNANIFKCYSNKLCNIIYDLTKHSFSNIFLRRIVSGFELLLLVFLKYKPTY